MQPWVLAVGWPVVLLMLALSVRQAWHGRVVNQRLAAVSSEAALTPRADTPPRLSFRERWTTGPGAAALRLRVSEYIMFRVASFFVPFLLGFVLRGLVAGLVLGLVGLAGLTLYFRQKQRRWLTDAEEALPEFLRGVAGALRAGSSLAQAMDLVAHDTVGPLGDEIRRVLRRERLGFSTAETLAEIARRVPSRDLGLAVMAITIQREVGGSLADVLDNIVETIVERQQLKSEIRILTAQGRVSGWLLTFMPFGLGLLMWFADPSYMGELVHGLLGWAMLGGAGVSVGIGGFVINRMVRTPEM